jgi:pimeloyl-ACP methyl ester carboxylesterase
VVLVGGDLGGPVIQDLALRHPEWVDRMVLFNSPLPYLKDAMAGIAGTRPPMEAADYFLRQGTDPDGLAAELTTPEQRRRYIATFYTSRFWAHPGAFTGDRGGVPHRTVRRRGEAARQLRWLREHVQPGGDRSRRCSAKNEVTRTLVLYGPSDHVIYPAFDAWRPRCSTRHVGPFLLRDCGHFVPWEAPHALVSGTTRSAATCWPAAEHTQAGRAACGSGVGGVDVVVVVRATQVIGPTMPSTGRPTEAWKSLTAASVPGPNGRRPSG